MALGDGIRRNIASVDPTERALLRDALIELNRRFFPGNRDDEPPGHVSWWFKQDEIHQGTHVHGGAGFVPWHREIVNRLEAMLRLVNPQLSLHYWDWTQDPRAIPNANLGGGRTGTLNLFTPEFMGYGGWELEHSIDEPWLSAGYYVPEASPAREDDPHNPADPPRNVVRLVVPGPHVLYPDNDIAGLDSFLAMREKLNEAHDYMHEFVDMGGIHRSFRDPFVFLLHSNVDRLYAKWQTDPAHSKRLNSAHVYQDQDGAVDPSLSENIEPWSTGRQITSTERIRPWGAPENQGIPHDYKHPFIVFPPPYDTNGSAVPFVRMNAALYSGTKCYFFSGNRYIRVTRGPMGAGTIDPEYPKDISAWGWGNFGRNGIDAALNSGVKCYFFSRHEYIRVTRGNVGSGTVDSGYPRNISEWGWGNFGKSGIDAALYSGTKCYFFSGNQYIRVTRGDIGAGTIDPGYPKNISNWGWGSFGKNGIDAALYSGAKSYFLSGNQYIRVTRGNTGAGTVDSGYPRLITGWGWPASFQDLWVMLSVSIRFPFLPETIHSGGLR